MTEAMSRREIEDVLTSIKRLVSQDVPARHVEGETAQRPEKLLLTAELRVAGPEDAPGAGATAAPLLLDPDLAKTASGDAELTLRPDGDGEQDIPPQGAAQPAPGLRPVVNMLQDGAAPSLIRRIANARGAPNLGDRTLPDDLAAPSGITSGQTARQTGNQTGHPPEQFLGPFADPIEDAALEQTLARLEAVLSGKPVPASSGSAGSGHAQPSRSEPDMPPAASAAIEQGSENVVDQIIDESMLYQLVAQIVRQELQGELGEKITRNIRKLVRQEVARELQLRKG